MKDVGRNRNAGGMERKISPVCLPGITGMRRASSSQLLVFLEVAWSRNSDSQTSAFLMLPDSAVGQRSRRGYVHPDSRLAAGLQTFGVKLELCLSPPTLRLHFL